MRFKIIFIVSAVVFLSFSLAYARHTIYQELNLQDNIISSVADPVSTQDAATKNYHDSTPGGINCILTYNGNILTYNGNVLTYCGG